MSCDYPIRCPYWKDGKCTADIETIIEETGMHPCERHQIGIDQQAAREIGEALDQGDIELARHIANSPFVTPYHRRR